MASTLGAVLAGINNGVSNGLDIYKTIEGEARQKRAESYQIKRDTLSDARYEDDKQYRMGRDKVGDERFADELDYRREKDKSGRELAAAAAATDNKWKTLTYNLNLDKYKLSRDKAVNEQNAKDKKEAMDWQTGHFTHMGKLMDDTGEFGGVVEYVNGNPDAAAALAIGYGIQPTSATINSTMLLERGDTLFLVQRGENGQPVADDKGDPVPVIDTDGDGKPDVIGIKKTELATRLGHSGPAIQAAGEGKATSLGSAYNDNSEGLQAKAESQYTENAATLSAATGEAEKQAVAAQQQHENFKKAEFDAFVPTGTGPRLHDAATNAPLNVEEAKKKEAANDVLLAEQTQAIGYRKEVAQHIANFPQRFKGADLAAANRNMEAIIAAGGTPTWGDIKFASLPGEERITKEKEYVEKLITGAIKGIDGKVLSAGGEGKKPSLVPVSGNMESELRAALEGNIEVLMFADKGPKEMAVVRTALGIAAQGGEPGAITWVIGEMKAARDATKLIGIVSEIPPDVGDTKARFQVGAEVSKIMAANPSYSFNKAYGAYKESLK